MIAEAVVTIEVKYWNSLAVFFDTMILMFNALLNTFIEKAHYISKKYYWYFIPANRPDFIETVPIFDFPNLQ